MPPQPVAVTAIAPQLRQEPSIAVVPVPEVPGPSPAQSEALPPVTVKETNLPLRQPAVDVRPSPPIKAEPPPFPYPQMGPVEKEGFSNFVKSMENFGHSILDNLAKLCQIAYDMRKYINNSSLPDERFNDLTDNQEAQINKILKSIPGLSVKLDYSQEKPAIVLVSPQGQTVTVPEIEHDQFVQPRAAVVPVVTQKIKL
jgi:hypothetical protein